MAKKAYVFLADGFEEVEGLTAVDLMRRAGIDVVTVSVMKGREVCGSHQIKVMADALFAELDFTDADLLVLPGGMPGTLHLQKHQGLEALLKDQNEKKKYIAAICAAPSILGALGFVKGRKAGIYPGMEEKLTNAEVSYDPVSTDGHIITSRGVGTAIPFALELVALLCGREKAEEIGKAIVFLKG